ncbi:MAG: FKBP-type peptidyl-prolyl cis-trans isomerase [Parvularculaceae bacterium]|nr:FKBP-type peptidyl-prolyl cis-trans isomerase [Parvularculaceae bacterium]
MKSGILICGLAAALIGVSACAKKDAAADAAADAAGETAAGTTTAEPAPADAATRDAAAIDLEKLAADNEVKSEKFLTENRARDGVKTTASGLQYMVLSEGPADGFSPKAEDVVDVHYVGTLIDGTEFDSSRRRGAAARFPLNRVIPGWTEGVQLMSEGDKYRFFIPSELAYGEAGTPGGPIGPNEALIFDVELIKVSNLERNLDAAKRFLAENAKKAGVKTTASGLQYEVLTKGASGGQSPNDADKVRVNYEGRLLNGTVFDSSYDRGEPIEFPLNRVIAGWTEGVQLMSEGDKFRFFIPAELAYGEAGTPGGPIGPNEALIFDVELLNVVK